MIQSDYEPLQRAASRLAGAVKQPAAAGAPAGGHAPRRRPLDMRGGPGSWWCDFKGSRPHEARRCCK